MHPRPSRTRMPSSAAFPKLELHVGVEIVHNELTALCTHILPTKDAVERPEISRWDTLRWNVSMQYSAPLVEPMGERRSAWWVLSQIMRRAGTAGAGPRPRRRPCSRAPTSFMLSQLFTQDARCSFDELKREALRRVSPRVPRPVGRAALRTDRRLEARTAGPARRSGTRSAPPTRPRWASRSPSCTRSRRQFKKFNAQLDFMGEPADVILHPDTAAERGIVDGQSACASTPRAVRSSSTAKVDPDHAQRRRAPSRTVT